MKNFRKIKNLRIQRNIRAISPVIATLLLIAIAVAAAVVVYSWTMSMVGSQSSQAQTSLRIEQVKFGQHGSAPLGTAIVTTDSTSTKINLDTTDNFDVGDSVKIGTAYTVVMAVEEATTDDDAYIDVTPALTAEPTAGVAVTEMFADGVAISIRNTGSVATVIQTVYIYQGDTAILEFDGAAYTIQPSKVLKLGFTDGAATSETDWSNLALLSGGTALSSPNKIWASTDGITFSSDLAVSTSYTVKVVTDNGFTVEGTYYTPSSFA